MLFLGGKTVSCRFGEFAGGLLDLVLPQSCPGCGAPGKICSSCQDSLRTTPQRVSTRVAINAPVYSCGPYAGAHRRIVIHAKERGNKYARQIMGATLAATVKYLSALGEIMPPQVTPIILIPAPTRERAAIVRGGDPITEACRYATEQLPRTGVMSLVYTASSAADSAGLSASQRRRNLSGSILPHDSVTRSKWDKYAGRSTFLLIDDVITTGSTIAETELVLASVGIEISAAIGFARV